MNLIFFPVQLFVFLLMRAALCIWSYFNSFGSV